MRSRTTSKRLHATTFDRFLDRRRVRPEDVFSGARLSALRRFYALLRVGMERRSVRRRRSPAPDALKLPESARSGRSEIGRGLARRIPPMPKARVCLHVGDALCVWPACQRARDAAGCCRAQERAFLHVRGKGGTSVWRRLAPPLPKRSVHLRCAMISCPTMRNAAPRRRGTFFRRAEGRAPDAALPPAAEGAGGEGRARSRPSVAPRLAPCVRDASGGRRRRPQKRADDAGSRRHWATTQIYTHVAGDRPKRPLSRASPCALGRGAGVRPA